MIRRLLLGCVTLAAVSTTAFAADLPSRRAPPVYVAPALPVFTWSGGYFGINAGYAFDSTKRYTVTGAAAGSFQTKDNGFTGGAQIGYNYELGNGLRVPGLSIVPGLGGTGGIVFGVEADAAYTDLKTAAATGGIAVGSRTDYVGTARGRLGVAFDTLLIYGTGGFAYGGVRDNVTFGGFTSASDKIRTGYAYGGGVEYAIPTSTFVNVFNSSAVTLKAEFIHYDLGSSSIFGGGVATRVRTDGNIVRAGLNYKLNFLQAAPVVARY